MAADTTTVSAVSDAAASMKDTLIAIGGAVLPYAAAVVALGAGWRFGKRFVKG
jgi:hypothetical protein